MICPKCGRDYIVASCPCERGLPIKPWPTWAKAVAIFRQQGDIGVGDTFHRLAERFGAEWVIKKLGVDCGCSGRRDVWNFSYRY